MSKTVQIWTHSTPSSVCHRPDLPGAACPVSGAVCWCASCCGRSALHLARSALLPVLCSLPGCAGGWGLHRRGIQGAPGWGGSIVSVEKKSKKAFLLKWWRFTTPSFLRKSPPPLLPISKISRKNKKTPTKGLCSVLYLPYKP